ncbi:hypothetical protein BDR03DRAFT_972493, partial [Suillus americanus]
MGLHIRPWPHWPSTVTGCKSFDQKQSMSGIPGLNIIGRAGCTIAPERLVL